MVTKKKYKVRNAPLSNKLTKYRKRNKRQSKKKRTKSKKYKLSRGGASRVRPVGKISGRSRSSQFEKVKFKKEAAYQLAAEEAYADQLAAAYADPLAAEAAEQQYSFMLVDLHGSYLKKKSGTSTFGRGASLRNDIVWFYSRYSNSTPNIPPDDLIEYISQQDWEKIFRGLKLLEKKYETFYGSNQQICEFDGDDMQIAIQFIHNISEPFQDEAKQMVDKFHPSISDCTSGHPQPNANCTIENIEGASSQNLFNAALTSTSCDVVSRTGWVYYIENLIKRCYSNFFVEPPAYIPSYWHIAATQYSVKRIYEGQEVVSIIDKREKELYCLTYGSGTDRHERVIVIFTNYDVVTVAFENIKALHSPETVLTHIELEGGEYGTDFFTYKVSETKCKISINDKQFTNLLDILSIPNRNVYITGIFEDRLFFIDDIMDVLLQIFGLNKDKVVGFYESCRGI